MDKKEKWRSKRETGRRRRTKGRRRGRWREIERDKVEVAVGEVVKDCVSVVSSQ